jgi:hypothetical protein
MARLEAAVARLVAGTTSPATVPVAVSRQEEAADRVVDLLAARAVAASPVLHDGAPGSGALVACVGYVLACDLARAGVAGSSADRHRRSVEAVRTLTAPAEFDGAAARVRALAGDPPDGRLHAAWAIADAALAGLDTTRHEWVDVDPAHTVAAGWVLVDRVGRLAAAAALIAAARAAQAVSSCDAETLVNAARRYAWNHLRGPAPEAATPLHVRRSADLVAWLATAGARAGT